MPVRGAVPVVIVVVLTLLAVPARADQPTLELDAAFTQVRVDALRIDGPQRPGGTTGVAVLEMDMVLNNRFLPAGTLLSSFGTVAGGQEKRIYGVEPNTGFVLPDLSVSYGPAAGDGWPDAGLLLLDDPLKRYLSFQYAPVGIVLGEFETNGPGRLLDTEHLPSNLFPNGGGMGLLDEDTLYVTSWAEQSLYTVDFEIAGEDLLLSNLTVVNPFIPGPGPDGVAIIPPNAPGELAAYAGNLIMARFGGSNDGFVDIFDPQGRGLARLATYRHNGTPGFTGPDGITFGPDGTLFVSDFDQTIFKISAVPEPATVMLLAAGAVWLVRRRS